jgi:hypothetical protein
MLVVCEDSKSGLFFWKSLSALYLKCDVLTTKGNLDLAKYIIDLRLVQDEILIVSLDRVSSGTVRSIVRDLLENSKINGYTIFFRSIIVLKNISCHLNIYVIGVAV